MTDDYEKMVIRHDKALFGDPDNMKASPGVIVEQARTNEILTDIRSDVKRLFWVVILAVVGALVNSVLKGAPLPHP